MNHPSENAFLVRNIANAPSAVPECETALTCKINYQGGDSEPDAPQAKVTATARAFTPPDLIANERDQELLAIAEVERFALHERKLFTAEGSGISSSEQTFLLAVSGLRVLVLDELTVEPAGSAFGGGAAKWTVQMVEVRHPEGCFRLLQAFPYGCQPARNESPAILAGVILMQRSNR